MKKNMLITCICIILLLIGFNGKISKIEELNNKASNVNSFVLISISSNGQISNAKVLYKENKKYVEYSLLINSGSLIELLNMSFDDMLTTKLDVAEYSELIFSKKKAFSKSISFFQDEKEITEHTIDMDIKTILNSTQWGKIDFNGFQIQEEKLEKIKFYKKNIAEKEWDIVKGFYNVNKWEGYNTGEKGVYQLWYCHKEKIAYEIYESSSCKDMILRCIWFDQKLNLSFDENNDDSLLKNFFDYLQKSKFKSIINECKRFSNDFIARTTV